MDKKYNKLLNLIEELDKKEQQIIIAIDGNCTSGKTTLADFLKLKYDANLFHMDDYFKSKNQEKSDENYMKHIDLIRLKKEIIDPLINDTDIQYQSFNCKTQELSAHTYVKKKKINIIEGAYSMHPDVLQTSNIKIFMKSNIFQQIRRIIKRNGIKELMNYMIVWIPKENAYFRHYQIQKMADYVIKTRH